MMNSISDFLAANAPLLTMLAILLVVVPTLIVFGGEAWRNWLEHKEIMASALNAQAAEKAAQYAAHTERLESRVRVLERIATDRGVDLGVEIEALRDEHPLN